MKKSLLFLIGASLFGANTFAQDVQPDRVVDSVWMADFDSSYSVYLDPTNAQAGIKDLTADLTKDLWISAPAAESRTKKVVTVENNILKIEQTRLKAGDNYGDISLSTFDWRGQSGVKFKHLVAEGKTVDTLGGMYVDMSRDRQVVMSFDLKVSKACVLRTDLVDANGRQGNGKASPNYQNTQKDTILVADVDTWLSRKYTWDYEMFDYYSGAYWGSSTGMWDNVGQVVYGTLDATKPFDAEGTYLWAKHGDEIKKHEIKQEEVIPVDSRTIGKIMFLVNDGGQGAIDETVTVEIKNLVLGSASKAVSFEPFTEGSTSLDYNPKNAYLVLARGEGPKVSVSTVETKSSLEVYPNPAKGQITVNENVTVTTVAGVATGVAGNGVLDISKLVKGTYYVVGTTGTTTLVVE